MKPELRHAMAMSLAEIRYERLISEACEAIDRVTRPKRLARGTTPPTLVFTDAERAWFRSPLKVQP